MLFGIKDELQTDLVSTNVTNTKKANVKLNNLSRVQKNMTPEQRTFLTASFIKSQFNYCPLIWIFCLKKALHRLINIHGVSLHVLDIKIILELH